LFEIDGHKSSVQVRSLEIRIPSLGSSPGVRMVLDRVVRHSLDRSKVLVKNAMRMLIGVAQVRMCACSAGLACPAHWLCSWQGRVKSNILRDTSLSVVNPVH
jgi:hypothetical protein